MDIAWCLYVQVNIQHGFVWFSEKNFKNLLRNFVWM